MSVEGGALGDPAVTCVVGVPCLDALDGPSVSAAAAVLCILQVPQTCIITETEDVGELFYLGL